MNQGVARAVERSHVRVWDLAEESHAVVDAHHAGQHHEGPISSAPGAHDKQFGVQALLDRVAKKR